MSALSIHKSALISRIMRGEFGTGNLTRVKNAIYRGETDGGLSPQSREIHGQRSAWRRVVSLGLHKQRGDR